LLAILLVFGLIALTALNYEMIPAVGLPSAVIVTTYPGASANDVEKDITRIIENQMSTLPGIQNMNSTSSNSFSTVSLEFRKDVNVRDKLPQIRELLNGIRGQLPEGIQGEPVIYIVEASAFLPIFSVRIDSSMNKEDLTKYLEDTISPALSRIDGVSKINIVGGNKREAVVNVNTWELESRKLSVLQIYEALQYNNLNVPAGSASFRGKSIAFTASGKFKSLDELKNLPVGYSGSTLIYLKDVADIEIKEQKPEIVIRESGNEYVMIDILKRDEGNTIFIVEEAKKIFDTMVVNTYGAVQYRIVSDHSETTKTSLKTVLETGITGLLLTIFVILLVLHDWRATIIISLSIPLSILFAVLGLYATGRSINLLTLSGMVVAIGMIVDNSIVILENTFNKFSQTHNKKEAARSGAAEMGGAVLASTLTSICVFAPLLFLRGIIGIILNDLSLTIVYALAASALVAVIVVPWLSSLILKKEDTVKKPAWLLFIQNKIDAA
ncbi:MAG TPA: efflux RND transporter permease subunit, partial [Spirochaetales bacterium]|nr:efflux RND transporter permease subunit [Spirochaetales bacterium]